MAQDRGVRPRPRVIAKLSVRGDAESGLEAVSQAGNFDELTEEAVTCGPIDLANRERGHRGAGCSRPSSITA